VPLEDALERLLGAHSFTLTYDSDGHLKRIALAMTAGAAHPATAAGAQTPALPPMDDAAAEATKRVSQYIQRNQTVQVGGRLGKALGTDTATFQDVLRVALKDPDPRVRAEASRSMVRALTGDPTVRDALVASMNGMSDDVLARALRSIAGADANGVLRGHEEGMASSEIDRFRQPAPLRFLRSGDPHRHAEGPAYHADLRRLEGAVVHDHRSATAIRRAAPTPTAQATLTEATTRGSSRRSAYRARSCIVSRCRHRAAGLQRSRWRVPASCARMTSAWPTASWSFVSG